VGPVSVTYARRAVPNIEAVLRHKRSDKEVIHAGRRAGELLKGGLILEEDVDEIEMVAVESREDSANDTPAKMRKDFRAAVEHGKRTPAKLPDRKIKDKGRCPRLGDRLVRDDRPGRAAEAERSGLLTLGLRVRHRHCHWVH